MIKRIALLAVVSLVSCVRDCESGFITGINGAYLKDDQILVEFQINDGGSTKTHWMSFSSDYLPRNGDSKEELQGKRYGWDKYTYHNGSIPPDLSRDGVALRATGYKQAGAEGVDRYVFKLFLPASYADKYKLEAEFDTHAVSAVCK